METLGKQQLRTRETQARLLDAAEKVFVRDGYEAAQLDAIAAAAGRSKGAVYTHFKSKEDLFLALFENRTRAYVERLVARLKQCRTQKESMDAFRDFFMELLEDKAWPILTMEFKLFALRHPEWKKRFRKAFELAKGPRWEADEEGIFGPLSGEEKMDNELAIVALGPILSGLILESHFEPGLLSERGLQRILGRIFDALFPLRGTE